MAKAALCCGAEQEEIMKKLMIAVVLMIAFNVSGCMMKNQLDAEVAYYRAQVAIKQVQQQPLFRITPAKIGEPITLGNVGMMEIYGQQHQTPIPQYVHSDFGVKTGIGAAQAAIWPIAGAVMVGKALDAAKGNNTSYSQTVTGENNTGRIAGPSNINANVAGNNNTLGGAVEQQIPTTTTTTTNTTTTTTPTTTTTGTTTTGNVNLTP
jgi:hypothetical protein